MRIAKSNLMAEWLTGYDWFAAGAAQGGFIRHLVDQGQQIADLVVGDGHDVGAAHRQHISALAIRRDIAHRELGERQGIGFFVDYDDHLRRSQAVGSGLHVEFELALHARAAQSGKGFFDDFCPRRIGLMLMGLLGVACTPW